MVYKPTEIILSQGQLLDSQGRPVNGIAYFSNHSRGVTGINKNGQATETAALNFRGEIRSVLRLIPLSLVIFVAIKIPFN